MDNTRDWLLAAAEGLIVEQGATALGLREVARRAGVSPMAVYRHFDGLDALREALRERGYDRLTRALAEGLAAPDAASRLWEVGKRYIAFARAEPAYYDLLFSGGLPPADAVRGVAHRRDATSFRFLVDRVREAMDAGVLAPADPELRAVHVWALLHGVVGLQSGGKLQLTPEEFETVVDGALHWIGARPSAP